MGSKGVPSPLKSLCWVAGGGVKPPLPPLVATLEGLKEFEKSKFVLKLN